MSCSPWYRAFSCALVVALMGVPPALAFAPPDASVSGYPDAIASSQPAPPPAPALPLEDLALVPILCPQGVRRHTVRLDPTETGPGHRWTLRFALDPHVPAGAPPPEAPAEVRIDVLSESGDAFGRSWNLTVKGPTSGTLTFGGAAGLTRPATVRFGFATCAGGGCYRITAADLNVHREAAVNRGGATLADAEPLLPAGTPSTALYEPEWVAMDLPPLPMFTRYLVLPVPAGHELTALIDRSVVDTGKGERSLDMSVWTVAGAPVTCFPESASWTAGDRGRSELSLVRSTGRGAYVIVGMRSSSGLEWGHRVGFQLAKRNAPVGGDEALAVPFAPQLFSTTRIREWPQCDPEQVDAFRLPVDPGIGGEVWTWLQPTPAEGCVDPITAVTVLHAADGAKLHPYEHLAADGVPSRSTLAFGVPRVGENYDRSRWPTSLHVDRASGGFDLYTATVSITRTSAAAPNPADPPPFPLAEFATVQRLLDEGRETPRSEELLEKRLAAFIAWQRRNATPAELSTLPSDAALRGQQQLREARRYLWALHRFSCDLTERVRDTLKAQVDSMGRSSSVATVITVYLGQRTFWKQLMALIGDLGFELREDPKTHAVTAHHKSIAFLFRDADVPPPGMTRVWIPPMAKEAHERAQALVRKMNAGTITDEELAEFYRLFQFVHDRGAEAAAVLKKSDERNQGLLALGSAFDVLLLALNAARPRLGATPATVPTKVNPPGPLPRSRIVPNPTVQAQPAVKLPPPMVPARRPPPLGSQHNPVNVAGKIADNGKAYRLNRSSVERESRIVGAPERPAKPNAKEQAEALRDANREGYAAERIAVRKEVHTTYVGDEAKRLINGRDLNAGPAADVVGRTRNGDYILSEAKGKNIDQALLQLDKSMEKLGKERVIRLELIVPESIEPGLSGFNVRNGLLHLGDKPHLINGKPVHVTFTTQ